ncbi:unnamed protein product [Durusdinium trenchii]|uniref:PPM-type phosphatase domain-containing protein n=1 Tax=Durusdinium trenchii TaxID=1381693 RepID=A0ABP0K057_9DINO
MGCCTSQSGKGPDKAKIAKTKSDKPPVNGKDGQLLTELDALSIVDIVESTGAAGSGRKIFVGGKRDVDPLNMASFVDRCVEIMGDADTLPAGIAFTCRKGLKPDTPNQDTWCALKMDTFSIFAVFDGHGPNGHEISHFVKEHLPKVIVQDPRSKAPEVGSCLADAFKKTQRLVAAAESRKRLYARTSGTTATVAFFDHSRSKLTIAHVADSAAAIGTKMGEKWLGKPLTRDHKPNVKGELERIEKTGAKIGFDGTSHRVYAKDSRFPGLNMSRSLGDTLGHAECGITCEPEITRLDIDTSSKQMLLICSDGVWEFISAQEAVEIVGMRPPELCDEAVSLLAKESWDRWIREEGAAVVDDITVGVVHIGKEDCGNCSI